MKAVVLGGTGGMGRAVAGGSSSAATRCFCSGATRPSWRSAADLQRAPAAASDRRRARALRSRGARWTSPPRSTPPTPRSAGSTRSSSPRRMFASQEALEADVELTRRLITVNYANTVVFCEHARKRLLARGGGRLAVFSSVAGDRGRKPVAIYGSSKAGLSAYLEALDHKFLAAGLSVLCVKPGFVKTGMTAGLKPPPFAGEPDQVARDVVRAIDKRRPVRLHAGDVGAGDAGDSLAAALRDAQDQLLMGVAVAGGHFLVTGGAGFIGTHLCRRLLALGARVTAIDSMKYARERDFPVRRFTLGTDAIESLSLDGIDGIFHLAAEKHNQSLATPAALFAANIDGTYQLFAAAARARVRKIVFSSSLYAYGRVRGAPLDEAELPVPDTLYGISKLAGEQLVAHAREARASTARCCATSSSMGRSSFPAWGTNRSSSPTSSGCSRARRPSCTATAARRSTTSTSTT